MRRPHRFQPQKSLHQRRTGLLLAPGWCTHAELTDAAACRKPATRATCTSYASGSPQREAWVPPRAAVSLPPARPHCRPVMDGTGAVCPDQWRGELGRARALSRGAFRCVTPENWGGGSAWPHCAGLEGLSGTVPAPGLCPNRTVLLPRGKRSLHSRGAGHIAQGTARGLSKAVAPAHVSHSPLPPHLHPAAAGP